MKSEKHAYYPYLENPWLTKYYTEDLTFQIGGFEIKGTKKNNYKSFEYKYLTFSPLNVEVEVFPFSSKPESIGYDFISIRAGALDAHIMELPEEVSILYFKEDGYKTKSMFTHYTYSKDYTELEEVLKDMWKTDPKNVSEVRAYLRKACKQDLTKN